MSNDATLREEVHRNPFWVCLLVFGVLAVDGGLRFSQLMAQRGRMSEAEQNQAATISQMSQELSQLPTVESKLQALSMDLLQVATTNAAAAQIVQEFNVQWTPGATTTSATNAAATNAAKSP